MLVLLMRWAWLAAASVPQLLRSSSVAVSTSHDFEDKATITAFCKEEDNSITSHGSTC